MAKSAKGGVKEPLGREAWVGAAMQMLAHGGVDSVRIEELARRLGVTKGSFYWHFRDRADLQGAMLDVWRSEIVTGVMNRLRAVPDPLDRFRRMMRLPFGEDRPDFDIEAAVRLWAQRDPRAQEAIVSADEIRIGFISEVLIAAGAPAEEARSRAIMVFSFLRVGHLLVGDRTLDDYERLLLSA